MTVRRHALGRTASGENVERFGLSSAGPIEVEVVTLGATLSAVRAPDRDRQLADVVLGFDDLDSWNGPHPHFGGTIGRYANRIARGHFELDGREYRLAANDGAHHLHGGPRGFDRVVWRVAKIGESSVRLAYASPDGDEGYPGNLEVEVGYALDGNALRIDLRARTDRPTPINLTNHAYFNLRDGGASEVLDHELWLAARDYTPVDATGIPTGAIESVESTPLDFSRPRRFRDRLDELLELRGGYDHNLVLARGSGPLPTVARVREPDSGRVLEVATTQPGLQVYTGNFLDGSVTGRGGVRYPRFGGFCLEAQRFPDSPNRPEFPSTILRPGDVYAETILYRFSSE
jgi:aldose 1-epimerase